MGPEVIDGLLRDRVVALGFFISNHQKLEQLHRLM